MEVSRDVTDNEIREFARVEPVEAPAGVAPASRARHLPGLGHPLIPPWHVAESGRTGARCTGTVDYRVDGRKAFVRATMTDSDDNVLSEASGLMIKLLPHQP